MSVLYYECHITIEPVFDEKLEEIKEIVKPFNFKVAHLLMKKREDDTEERSKTDTFMTGHSKADYWDLEGRMCQLIDKLKLSGFKVWRYKIEEIAIDSRISDVFELLG